MHGSCDRKHVWQDLCERSLKRDPRGHWGGWKASAWIPHGDGRKTLIEGPDRHSDTQKVNNTTATTTTSSERRNWLQQSGTEEIWQSSPFVVLTMNMNSENLQTTGSSFKSVAFSTKSRKY